MIKKVVVAVTLFVVIFLCGCKEIQHVRVLKLAHGLDQKHSLHQGLLYMGEFLDSISEGRMKVDIYPSAQLGSETQNIELVQIGSLAMTKVSSASLEGFADEYKAFGIPYMIQSKEHLIEVLDGEIGEDLKTSTERFLFRGVGYYDAGARSFYTMKRAVMKSEDLSRTKNPCNEKSGSSGYDACIWRLGNTYFMGGTLYSFAEWSCGWCREQFTLFCHLPSS